MKFEAGKYYKTRNGNKAKIYAIYVNQVHGAIELKSSWVSCGWDVDGNCFSFGLINEDLVSGWIEEYESIKCIVKDCENHKHQGAFVGDLCAPCNEYITTGKGIYSQAYRNAQQKHPAESWEIDKKIMVSMDGKEWFKKHFAKYENGIVCTWLYGTSWTSDDSVTDWKYAKEPEGEV